MKYINGYFTTLLCAILCACCISIQAQETGYFNHHYFQPVLINPGATGYQGDQQFLAAYKHNFSDFEGSARTFTGVYHASFAENNGVGLQLFSDRIGASSLVSGQLSYAYRFSFDQVKLGLGLSAGLQTFKIKDAFDDPNLDPTDELLLEALDGYLLFDGGLGVYGEVNEKMFFGISFPNLVKNRLSDINGDLNLEELESLSYAFLLGYRFDVKNYNFTVEPSITVKDLRYSPFLVDANVRISFLDEQLVGGLGYTLGDNSRAALLLGTRINALRIFYSYDVSLGDFQQYNNGSHEITLVYRIPKKMMEAMPATR